MQETLPARDIQFYLWQTGTDIRAWLFTTRTIITSHGAAVMRDEATIDIEQMSSSLVAVTDPTAFAASFASSQPLLARLPLASSAK